MERNKPDFQNRYEDENRYDNMYIKPDASGWTYRADDEEEEYDDGEIWQDAEYDDE